MGRHTFWPDFWAVLWTLFSCFGSRDIVFSWGMWQSCTCWAFTSRSQSLACTPLVSAAIHLEQSVVALTLPCTTVGSPHSAKGQGSHVQRARCTALRPSVRLSVCRSLLGAYRPNPCNKLWVNMYNMHWIRTYNQDSRNCFASFPSPRKYTRHRSY